MVTVLPAQERDDLAYTAAVDIWALGVVTYELLNGCPPFTCHDKKETEQRINSGLMPEVCLLQSTAC
jgi:serine/threonine protein kinase